MKNHLKAPSTAPTLCTVSTGFTLLELMLTIAILGILAAVALPSYRNQIIRSKRADAMAALESLSNAMITYYANNGASYLGATVTGGNGIAVFTNQVPVDGGSAYYTLSVNVTARGRYTATATPVAGSSQEADGELTLDQSGARTWNGENNWP